MNAEQLSKAAESMMFAEELAEWFSNAERMLKLWYDPKGKRRFERAMPIYNDVDFTRGQLQSIDGMMTQLLTGEDYYNYLLAIRRISEREGFAGDYPNDSWLECARLNRKK